MKKPALHLFNTLTRKKELFTPIKEGQVSMYTCGPTVYNYAHIGNLRTYVFEDLLRRTLHYFGYSVKQVMNITDVDDKTIKGALEKGITLDAFTKPYKDAFFTDLKTLGIEPVEAYPEATAFIPQMVSMIERLIKAGVCYQGKDQSVYYKISAFPNYGCLSHLKLDELKVGARVASDEYEKECVADFVVWKALDPKRDGDIFWESPFGPGRPGWHLECSLMAQELLGQTIDIHCGGVDNIFPHHENEIAQSEADTGKPFSHYWLHSEHLIVEGKKMSKRFHNFYTLRDLIEKKGASGRQVRFLLLQTHYKTQLNFTFEGLTAASHALDRLDAFVRRLSDWENDAVNSTPSDLTTRQETLFTKALADDLNISRALAALFDYIKEVNTALDKELLSKTGAKEALSFLKRCDSVLNVLSFEKEDKIPQEIKEALDRRILARNEKNWALADELRDFITEQGFVIEDTSKGARVIRKST